MQDAVEFAKAIADETRQQIMQLCCCQELCVSDLVAQIGLSQPTISHHLGVLRAAGLVTAERRGREIYYTLNQDRMTYCCGQLMLTFAPQAAATKTMIHLLEDE